jgi:hypothetical protein
MSTVKTNNILDASGGNTATINSMTPTADSLQGFRNRIINGDMRIDQRNAGASVTITNTADVTYTLDRWFGYGTVASKFSIEQTISGVSAPTGFTDYFGVTSLSAYSVLTGDSFSVGQAIEGLNVADLGWGTASAKSITISFWVRSSLTGTFGGALRNSAVNRSYPFTYTISSANTWEQKSITIAGDTSGTWLTTNGVGIRLGFGLGQGSTFNGTAGAWAGANYNNATGATSVVGTNGATFYITGVQLEVGSVATPFERRPYGAELSLCQRYYYKVSGDTKWFGIGYVIDSTRAQGITSFPVTMRTAPSAVEQTGTAANYGVITGTTSTTCSSVPTFNASTSEFSAVTLFTVSSGLTASQSIALRSLAASVYLAWSAEL